MQTRRNFLQQATAVAAASYFDIKVANALSPSQTKPADWYDRPMRWAQVAFVDNDPGRYDLKFWIDYFRKCHVDAACLSAGGVTAFYPTKLPFHHRSKALGSMDSFGEFTAGCRTLGMNVVARTDSNACRKDVVDAHPDWIAVDANGQMKKHPSAEGFWITCALGPYNFEFMTEVHREIVLMYKVDGIFTNRWAGSGMCYCQHCKENFHRFSGLDLPRTLDPQDRARQQHILWNQSRLFEVWRLWDKTIKEHNPHAAYIANAGGGALSDLDMVEIGRLAPTLFADRQGRAMSQSAIMPWSNGKNAKEYRATLGDKAIVGIFSLAHGGLWRDSVQNNAETELWASDGIAQGMRPWFVKFGAQITDSRWMPTVQKLYEWHYENEKYLRNTKNLARVGLVYSQQTALFYAGPKAATLVEEPAQGFYEALVRARMPFEMVHDHLLDEEAIRRFDVLILPNIAALSQKQCEQLRRYVEGGGSIVATYETSLCDEWGKRQKDFGLASLFGASYQSAEPTKVNAYMMMESDPEHAALFKGFEDAHRIINGENRAIVKPLGSSSSPLTLVPDFPWLPMEEVYARPVQAKEPAVLLHSAGKGRVVYFPADVDRTFWRSLDEDLGKLLANAVAWAANSQPVLKVDGSGILDVAVWEQKNGSATVHLVNMTNPMYTKGPADAIYPIGEQKVEVTLPSSRKVARAHLLTAKQPVTFTQEDRTVRFSVPKIEVHEVVALDYHA